MAISVQERKDLVAAYWQGFPRRAFELAFLCRKLFNVMPNIDWIGLMKAEVALNPTPGLEVPAFQAELQRLYDSIE